MSAKYYYLWSLGSALGAVQTLVQLLQIFAYMCLVGRALAVTSNFNYFKDVSYTWLYEEFPVAGMAEPREVSSLKHSEGTLLVERMDEPSPQIRSGSTSQSQGSVPSFLLLGDLGKGNVMTVIV